MSELEALLDEPVDSWFDTIHHSAHFQGAKRLQLSERYRTWQAMRTADGAIPAQTYYHFLDFLFEGNLPGGGRTAYPTLTEAEIPLMGQPASTWAPWPHNADYTAISDVLLKLGNDPSLSFGIPYTTLNLKARLWEGMVPMPECRWKEKQLDKAENWNDAMQFFFQIVWVFFFLNKAEVQLCRKTVFNLVYQKVAPFQNALNARRRAFDPSAPLINAQGMWVEFIEALFKTMVQRTHSWMAERVTEVQAALRAQYEQALTTASPGDLFELGKNFSDYTADLNKILGQADRTIYMSMKGYYGYTSPSIHHLASLVDQQTFYYDCMDSLPYPAHKSLLENPNDPNLGFASSAAVMAVYNEATTLRAQIRAMVRPPLAQLQQEHWITTLKSRIRWSLSHGGPRDQTWGFVAYRLTYVDDDCWSQFLAKLESQRRDSAGWVAGGAEIFDTAGLQWLDGRTLGLPENDSEAAKRHFMQTFVHSREKLPRMLQMHFVTVDQESLDSYMIDTDQNATLQPLGDYGGFVNIIDTIHRPKEDTYPEYKAKLRVLGSFLWNYIFPALQSLSMVPERMFAAAVMHPLKVFTGPTGHIQEQQRDTVCCVRDVLILETARKMAGR